MSLTRCPRCAKQVPETSSFCRRCGLRLYDVAPAARPVLAMPARPATPARPAKPAPAPAPRQPARPRRGILSMVVVVAAIGIFRSYHRTTTPPVPSPLPPSFNFNNNRTWSPPSIDPNSPLYRLNSPPKSLLTTRPWTEPPAQPGQPRYSPSNFPRYLEPSRPVEPYAPPPSPRKGP